MAACLPPIHGFVFLLVAIDKPSSSAANPPRLATMSQSWSETKHSCEAGSGPAANEKARAGKEISRSGPSATTEFLILLASLV